MSRPRMRLQAMAQDCTRGCSGESNHRPSYPVRPLRRLRNRLRLWKSAPTCSRTINVHRSGRPMSARSGRRSRRRQPTARPGTRRAGTWGRCGICVAKAGHSLHGRSACKATSATRPRGCSPPSKARTPQAACAPRGCTSRGGARSKCSSGAGARPPPASPGPLARPHLLDRSSPPRICGAQAPTPGPPASLAPASSPAHTGAAT
mmetsp:Transcript_103142/g.288951  ORF Transcript_103142/g.288951 Transcript_103142/m.288951 type:complete len:205 (-) Transcript_103142:131-745(-)